MSTGSPRFSATSPENATRFGPTTAPTVAPQTTSPSVEARRPGGTRSAAAYRDSWLELLPNPINSVPRTRVGSDPVMTAPVATNAPATLIV